MNLELDINQSLTSEQCKFASKAMGSFIRMLEDNVLTMLSINICTIF